MHLSKDVIQEHSIICSIHFTGGKRNGKNDVPIFFPWTKSRRPAKVRQLPQIPTTRSSYIPIQRRREVVAHDHSYCQPLTSALPSVTKALTGSCLLSVPKPEVVYVFLTSDVSINTDQTFINTDQAMYTTLQPTRSVRDSAVDSASQTDPLVISSGGPFRIEKIKDDQVLVRFYTGFDDYELLLIYFNFLGPCVNHLQYWNSNRSSKDTHETRGAPRSLSPLNEFFLVLCRFKTWTTRAGFGFPIWDFPVLGAPDLYNMDQRS